MGVNWGYVRISTKEKEGKQKLDSQIAKLEKFGISKFFIKTEEKSGTILERPILMEFLHNLQPGDSITMCEVSRFSRAEDLDATIDLYKTFMEKGIDIIFIDNPLANTTHVKQMSENLAGIKFDGIDGGIAAGIKQILNAVAELNFKTLFEQAKNERIAISNRVKRGLENAKSEGRVGGRPKKVLEPELIEDLKKYIAGELTSKFIKNKFNIKERSFRYYIDKIKEMQA